MLLVTAEEMREMDRKTMDEIGIPGAVLMENAGVQVARKITERVSVPAKVLILAGHGNNGGDGFVIGRHLGNAGYDVETWVIGDLDKSTMETKIHHQAYIRAKYVTYQYQDELQLKLLQSLKHADVIVDAMLGTGISGPLREPIRSIVDEVNEMRALKVAVDIPTGVDSNTGMVHQAFRADLTVTFALPKLGQMLYPGFQFVGHLEVVDISIPPIVVQSIGVKRHLLSVDTVREKLPIRKQNTHKGTYGHALLLGGSIGMPGAPALATLSSLRVGAGLTTVVVPKSIQSMVFSQIPEAICLKWNETDSGHLDLTRIDSLLSNEHKYTALGIGPGMGVWENGLEGLEKLMRSFPGPMVIDADGLNLLSSNPRLLLDRKGPTILTPHPGEMSRLIGKEIQFIEQNRIQVALEFAQTYQVYLVLKGAHSIIATPSGELFINPTGGPELAKGGSGDVLTGMLTGLLAQKIPVEDAVLLSVFLHGTAGSLAAATSNYSVLARDVIEQIGYAMKKVVDSR